MLKFHLYNGIVIANSLYLHRGYSLYITSFTWIQHNAWYLANSGFAFGKFLEFFPPNIFDPRLVESTDDSEGQLYFLTGLKAKSLKSRP